MVTRQTPKPRLDDTLFAACGLAWGAGIIHLQAAIGHLGESVLYAVLFDLVACAQFAWGVALYRRPGTGVLRAGVAGSLAIVAVWLMSRTTGLPLGPSPWRPEGVGTLDAIATADELVLALMAVLRLRGRGSSRLVTGVALGLILLSSLTPTVGGQVH
jgi:hypothetical protein